jgi:hypothetical protein
VPQTLRGPKQVVSPSSTETCPSSCVSDRQGTRLGGYRPLTTRGLIQGHSTCQWGQGLLDDAHPVFSRVVT